MAVIFEAILPLRIKSEPNARYGHWGARHKATSALRAAAIIVPLTATKILPAVVTLTRIAPRELDDDNLAGAFKALRDGVADRFGIDDRRRDVVRYQYAQERGKPGEYAARITIEGGDDATGTARHSPH